MTRHEGKAGITINPPSITPFTRPPHSLQHLARVAPSDVPSSTYPPSHGTLILYILYHPIHLHLQMSISILQTFPII